MSAWAWVVYALAVARVTGLVTQDQITEAPRNWLISRLPQTHFGAAVTDLVTCPWCASIWLAAIAAPLVWWCGWSLWLFIPALALAFSQIVGMLAGVGRD